MFYSHFFRASIPMTGRDLTIAALPLDPQSVATISYPDGRYFKHKNNKNTHAQKILIERKKRPGCLIAFQAAWS
jgi:hypothetical protein